MGLQNQLNTDPGVQRLYSVALYVWRPLKRTWEFVIDNCHAWTSNDAKMKIRASYPNQHIRVIAAGVTLGFFVNDEHGEELSV